MHVIGNIQHGTLEFWIYNDGTAVMILLRFGRHICNDAIRAREHASSMDLSLHLRCTVLATLHILEALKKWIPCVQNAG